MTVSEPQDNKMSVAKQHLHASAPAFRFQPHDCKTEAEFLARCQELAQRHFAIPTLRDSQKEVLAALFKNAGVLATLPTGAGKTLLYTLPALVSPGGPVLIVCPLISLMRDQVRRMVAANIPAVLFTGDQSEEERRAARDLLLSGQVRLIFASPERFVLPSFVRLLSRIRVSMVVVDEAHCVVSWGPAFRPEYSDLAKVISQLSPQKVLALTATASRSSRKIIVQKVFPEGITAEEIVFRPLGKNIFIEVERVFSEDEKWQSLVSTLQTAEYRKAIVYFPKREMCESSVRQLRKSGIHAVVYHAGLAREERKAVEEYVHSATGKVVVCATQAFGMGVDVSGVRLVVVYGFPGSIEEYFQMIGRAGRGGEASRSLLLWSGADPKKRFFQFNASFPDGQEIRTSLSSVARYFPAEKCQRFATRTEIREALNVADKDAERKTAGLIAALRLMGVVESPLAHEDYLEIRLPLGLSVDKILADLPDGITRRSLLWSAVCHLAPNGWRALSGAMGVFPLRAICDEAQMSPERCLEVLDYYVQSKKLTYRHLTSALVSEGLFFTDTLSAAHKALVAYLRTRSDFLESLTQLEKLAQSQSCRLASSELFFGSAKVGPRKFSCGQCDLCLDAKAKWGAPHPFVRFAENLTS